MKGREYSQLNALYLFGFLFFFFFTQALGMRVVKKTDRPEQKVILNSDYRFYCGIQVS